VHAGMLAHYRALGQLRNNEPALRDGSFETLLTADKQQVYAFRRRAAGQSKGLVVVLNNSNQSQSVQLPGVKGQPEVLYQSEAASFKKNKCLLPPLGFVIFREP
jgi:glycosidase